VISLAEVFHRHWPEYQREFGAQILPSHQWAAQCIMRCRTPALGGEVYHCADCGQHHYAYHSCNHRACPQCGQSDTSDWLEQQKLQLLPVPYYLITFTVPEGLRAWLRSHQKLGYGLLLRESAQALQDVAGRPKYLGAQLGFLSVLHTWGRQLQYHPHVHCVVPAGGLDAEGLHWVSPRSPNFFLPQRVLAARFRTRLKTALRAPEALDTDPIPAAVWRQDWVVDIQPAGRGEPALKYLAAYVQRTALGPERILQDEQGQITFKYKDTQDRQWHVRVLPALEFIRRFLQHVLPKGFQRVRHYGWLSPAAAGRWRTILSLLEWHPPEPKPSVPPPRVCPHCGSANLACLGQLPRAPPSPTIR
jgi:hypothetical protein